ncbi:MAG: hypothetical protein Q8936_19045 [Bacillota bacterium]|nr:hypothetical protein [Bacillota bacterium]
MKKQFALISLCIILIASVVGCGNAAKSENNSENKKTSTASSETQKTSSDNSETQKTSSDAKNSNNDTSASNYKLAGDTFTVIKESETTDLQYEKGKYPEVDAAFAIIKEYYLNGIDAVSNKIVSTDFDSSRNDEDKWATVPLTDKDKKQLDLDYQSFKNQVTDKIQDITIEKYQWETTIGGVSKYSIDLTLNLVIKTDKGDSYSVPSYVTVLNKDGNMKIHIK